MQYTEQTLLADESILYQARLRWFRYMYGPAMAALGWKLSDLGERYVALPGYGMILLALGLLFIFKAWLDGVTSEFVVTSSRVLIKYGSIRRRTLELLLSRIEWSALTIA